LLDNRRLMPRTSLHCARHWSLAVYCAILLCPTEVLAARQWQARTSTRSQGPAAVHHLNEFNCIAIHSSSTGVVVDTNGAPKIELLWASPRVLRVLVSVDGSLHKEASYAVVGEHAAEIPFSIRDLDSDFRISSAGLSAHINKKSCRIAFYTADDLRLISEEEPFHGLGWSDDGARFAYRSMGATEHFYGLGQDNEAYLGRLDRRGTKRDLWTGQKINAGRVTAEIPIPFFMSTGNQGGGYGIFFDNSFRTEFDMGAESRDYYSWKALGGDLLFYFIAGPSFPSILTSYTALTGRMPMPPLWTLGFIQSKCTYWDWREIDEVASEMRKRRIPMDAMVFDYDWSETIQNFRWHSRWQNQSPAKLSSYAAAGTKFLLSTSGPMLRRDSTNYEEAKRRNLLATDGNGQPVTCGYYGGDLLDVTAPDLKAWLWPQLEHLHRDGIKGWWLDLTEPEGEPPETVYQGGLSAKIHNAYSLLNSKMYYEMLNENDPEGRAFILTRTGSPGIQKYGAAVWSGDINSDYETLTAHVPEALNTAMSGIPLWTQDSGGFLSGLYKDNLKDHGLLYQRWLQFSTFTPITRAHHVGPSAPFMFGAAVEAGSKHYLDLRYRLLPYIYSYHWQAHNTGAPLMRPLVYAYQDDPNVTNLKTQYLFGREFMVAPIVTEGTTSRQVYFPRGRWIDYDTGRVYAGGDTYAVPAPQERIPLFVRSGAIIPLAPPMQHTGEKPWDPLTIEVFPEGQSSFLLYNDDGRSTNYAAGHQFTETLLTSVVHEGRRITLAVDESNKLYTPNSYEFAVHLPREPSEVLAETRSLDVHVDRSALDGKGEGYYWDRASSILYAKVRTSDLLRYKVTINLNGD